MYVVPSSMGTQKTKRPISPGLVNCDAFVYPKPPPQPPRSGGTRQAGEQVLWPRGQRSPEDRLKNPEKHFVRVR